LLMHGARLGPPRQGFMRVFRGEIALHKPMLPSGLRSGMPSWNRPIWNPSSNYLDVTHSLSIALWLALHKSELAKITQIIGPDRPVDPQTDIALAENWTRFKPHTDGPGVVLVCSTLAPLRVRECRRWHRVCSHKGERNTRRLQPATAK